MNSTKKFTGKAEFYFKARPDYSNEFINYLLGNIIKANHNVIADIGSGTGKLSKEFIARNFKTYCVEPNTDMRSVADETYNNYANYISINGTAENTTLDNNSADVITVAQAFHWFDTVKFKVECKRILRKDGVVVLVWNSRVSDNPLNKANAELLKKYCPDFYGFSGGDDKVPQLINSFFEGKFEVKHFDNNLCYNKNDFVARNLSASYALKHDNEKYPEFIEALGKLFDEFSINGIITIPNITVAYWGRI